jgi:N-acetylmuramoyl-L-alanine amidase
VSTTEEVNELKARVEALEAQQAVQTEALRALVEGHWTDPMPHAAALISSLYGPDGAPEPYAPVDFPKDEEGGEEETPPPPTEIAWIGSPNYQEGRSGQYPIAIVVHTMGGSLASCDSWFNNPASQVSSHYGVGLQGQAHQYVQLTDTAWMNGILEPGNKWPGPSGVNPNKLSVGIETEDLGSGATAVTDEMYEAVVDLCLVALMQYPDIQYLTDHQVISPQSRPVCAGNRWRSGRLQDLASELGLELILMA